MELALFLTSLNYDFQDKFMSDFAYDLFVSMT
jgi:hypothetical protein